MQKVDIKAIVKNLNKEELRDLNKIVRNCYIRRVSLIFKLLDKLEFWGRRKGKIE